MKTTSPVYILDAMRTPFGILNGVFKHMRAEKLAAGVIEKILERTPVDQINHVILANAVGAGGNLARLAWLTAGGSTVVPCTTLDYQCGGGIQAIHFGTAMIASGCAEVVMVGGVESTSTEPRRKLHSHDPDYCIENEGYIKRARFSPDQLGDDDMIDAAEACAVQEKLTRAMLDQIAIESHKRSNMDETKTLLKPFIAPIWNGQSMIQQDEGLGRRHIESLIRRIKPFKEGGILTSGNTCLKNDGAGMVILCSENYLEKKQLQPLGRLVHIANSARNPIESSMAHVDAMEVCLKEMALTLSDMAQIEINEAFASKWWYVKKHFEMNQDVAMNQINPFGGALSIGHPYSASGISLLIMLLAGLKPYTYGIAGMGVAGGQGCALIVEKR